MSSFYYSARAHGLVRALPLAHLVDADLLVNGIPSEDPGRNFHHAGVGRVADAMMLQAINTIGPGVRECDVAAAVYHQQTSGTADFGGDRACTPSFLCVGERAIAPHAKWTDEPLLASTIVNLELFAHWHRYQVNLARSVGKPAPAFRNSRSPLWRV